jgi:hypothetical protein
MMRRNTMSATATQQYTLILDDEEHSRLARILEKALREMEIEWHRADALSYREGLKHEAAILERLTNKVRQLRD